MANDEEPARPGRESKDNDQIKPRDSSSQRNKPKYEAQSQVGKLWDAFGDPEQSANKLAGANNSRDTDRKDVTVSGVLKSMSFDNIKSFYKAPCARDSLLTGIGVGFAGGGLRTILGGMVFPIMAYNRDVLVDNSTRDTIVTSCRQLGCRYIRRCIGGLVRVLSKSPKERTGWRQTNRRIDEGSQTQKDAGKGQGCRRASGGGEETEELDQPIKLQVLVASMRMGRTESGEFDVGFPLHSS